ncbi:MAG: RNA polymerase sigma factor, partial [Planctomycetota bacterium]
QGFDVLEDKLLIWKVKKGDKSAFCQIYEKYRDDLLRIASGLLKERAVAEDVVHDVFVTFIHSVDRFKLTGSLRGYLTTCVVNKIRNLHRTKARHGTVNIDGIDPPTSDLKRPDQWMVQGEMKFSTIAAMQETSVKTVMSRYRYGITKLRSLLNSEEIA